MKKTAAWPRSRSLALGEHRRGRSTGGSLHHESGLGKGADLGGLAGADARCAQLAQAAGTSGKTWRAYLSTQGADAVNARDRIGNGPWQNAKGVVIAKNVDELHGPTTTSPSRPR